LASSLALLEVRCHFRVSPYDTISKISFLGRFIHDLGVKTPVKVPRFPLADGEGDSPVIIPFQLLMPQQKPRNNVL